MFAFGYFFFTPEIQALRMYNDSYIVQMGNLNNVAGNSSGSGRNLSITVGETGSGLYTGSGYKVRAGFQYIHSIIKFSFKASPTFIDFGELPITTFTTRTGTITISNGSAHGYAVTAQESHELFDEASGQYIHNTTCDNGLCTATTSDTWSNTLTYGFGYRCDNLNGTDCASGFGASTSFKQFAASPSAATVMTGTNVGRNKQVQITYQINISATQPTGLYRNIITYIATPTF
ncbi:MAG: hypothetical protein ACREGI_05465 [Candidatus Levyibacteriota bacterium]